jgi:hypothetical protein
MSLQSRTESPARNAAGAKATPNATHRWSRWRGSCAGQILIAAQGCRGARRARLSRPERRALCRGRRGLDARRLAGPPVARCVLPGIRRITHRLPPVACRAARRRAARDRRAKSARRHAGKAARCGARSAGSERLALRVTAFAFRAARRARAEVFPRSRIGCAYPPPPAFPVLPAIRA